MNANAETEKLLLWLLRERKQGAGVVSLTHQNVGGFGAALGKWPIAEEDGEPILTQLAHDLYRAACDDADGQNAPGAQQYVALFFAEPDMRTPASRLPFLVMSARQAALGPPGEGIATEPPTQSGFVAQVMRHSEFSQRHAWQVVGHALGMLERHALTMAQENQRLQQHNFELTRGYEGLLSEQHFRELAAGTAVHEREERSRFYGRIWQFAQLGAMKLGWMGLPAPQGAGAPPPGSEPKRSSVKAELPADAGAAGGAHVSPSSEPSPPAPPSDSLLAAHLRGLLSSLNEQQLLALQSTLTPEQMQALGAIWNALVNVPSSDTTPSDSAESSS